ncbi:hypothetical protein HC028_16250 [Planosporangium flavigriseum]|nr:hypothetical protein [Planosporangium flavigriseum]NJC66043.1 hypothetical protein [Planosporangium flavigriseum]
MDCWQESTCVVCPAQVLGLGEFDVSDRPGPDSRYEPEIGYRVNVHTLTPVCVHPYRVGLPVGPYASAGKPVPPITQQPPAPSSAHLELPEDATDLEGWLIATLRTADADAMASALRRAEAIAARRFPARDVVAAMRRVLSVELTHD